ncbi:MAG: relaxase/mobilization nuclease domain-containing protein [Simplicispira suum]|uniref:relaxase/mobilization nuclease domain-containing protein n=1 Tax=Simplicispira suum TaxID=2109915 RepID=UPI001C6C9C06|nr:relaxase/mobilization nuclease domain-containing protein [Simplicispira suum]MBW7833193.1 relaxase/mobilization nuclease domain-containing protein [Simplicispira suum]
MASFAQLEVEVPAPQAGVILKHKVGSGARGLLDYAASKATDIDGIITNKPIYSNVSETPRSIAKEFGFLRRLRPKLNKAVGHLIIAPKSKFQTQADWEKAANIATREHGIENTAFACYLHTDTEHPHLHIVYSRIRFDGSVVSDSNSYRTNERAARKIESAFGIPTLQTRPRESQPIDSQRAYSAERREQRIEAKIQRKNQENARQRYFTHTSENKSNRGQLRKTSEIGVRNLQPSIMAHNRDAEFESLLPDNERFGGRESRYVRWGGPGDSRELIKIIPQPNPKTTGRRRIKMTTQTEFQRIEDVIKNVLNDPAVDSPVEFKRRLDAALADAEIEAFARFHRRGKDDDAEISGWSLMFSQGTSVAASNISRRLSWAHVAAELNANAARRRRRDESAALAEEALGFLLLRPAQAIPAQGEEAPLTPRRARVGDLDEPVPGPSWSWPAAAVDGIYETRDALAIRPNFIDRLSPAELDQLVFKLCDRAEKKWGGDALQAEGLLVDHPQLFVALVNEAAQRPGLSISRPPELAAAIEVARAARAAAAGAGLSPAAPAPLDFLAFSAAEPAPAPAVASAPAPV